MAFFLRFDRRRRGLDHQIAGERAMMTSATMRKVFELVAKIGPTDAPVVIRGESGTGKESIAREIHRQSRRAAAPFVRVACGAISDLELDARLFGSPATSPPTSPPTSPSAGAPTASGFLASAAGGTLFLHNVTQLPFWAMVKLLDAFQQPGDPAESEFPAAVMGRGDVRLVASTDADLEAAMSQNRFYSGLYYYLSVFHINIPPLRERPEDLKELAEHFLAVAGTMRGAAEEKRRFTPEAWEHLLSYAWPGNIRELAAVVARAAILAEGEEIGVETVSHCLPPRDLLPDSLDQLSSVSVDLGGGLRQIEQRIVEEVLQRCRGNKAAAARILGLHRRTLYRLLKEAEKPSP
jgi:DNA-binding NtrC family response regulator